MRRMAVWAIVLGCGAGFAMPGLAMAAPPAATSSATAQALAEAAFRPGAPAADLDASALFSNDSYAPGVGLFHWNGETQVRSGNDSLQVSVGTLHLAPGGLALPGTREDLETQSYDVTYVHRWPRGFSFGPVELDVAPHAGVGVDSYGAGSAEAGASVHLSKADLAAKRLEQLGVKDGSRAFGDKGRWYLFAAASGRAVGLNMLHGDSGWNRAGWSTDPTSRLVGDTQIGVGWRKGPMQTSFGFVHREVKGDHLMYGVDPHSDSMVAFSFSIRPH